jgi:ribonuclease HII
MALHDPKLPPDFVRERDAGCLVAGVDEAGRGPWAGPVVAAAVILDEGRLPIGLNDSKKLTEKKRETLFDALEEQAVSIGVAIGEVRDIDENNILVSTLSAMRRAVYALQVKPGLVLIDGNKAPRLDMPTETLVKGDAKSLSIAAASIIAKVTRDRIMRELHRDFPNYGWDRNKGYGTKAHDAALRQFGVTPHHRRSFKPIHNMLIEESSLTY